MPSWVKAMADMLSLNRVVGVSIVVNNSESTKFIIGKPGKPEGAVTVAYYLYNQVEAPSRCRNPCSHTGRDSESSLDQPPLYGEVPSFKGDLYIPRDLNYRPYRGRIPGLLSFVSEQMVNQDHP